MSYRIAALVILLVFVAGTFLATRYDRVGWAQETSPGAASVPTPGADDPFGDSPAGAAPAADDPFGAPASPAPGAAAPAKSTGAVAVREADDESEEADYEYGDGADYGGYGSDYGGTGYEGDMGSSGMMGEYGMESRPPTFEERLSRQVLSLRQAKTGQQRQQAQEALEKLLSDYFDSDMQRRQQELAKVKERVTRLESLREKRRAAKEEIIELQLKTMVNESKGLGFFSKPLTGEFHGPGGGYGGMYGGEYMDEYGMSSRPPGFQERLSRQVLSLRQAKSDRQRQQAQQGLENLLSDYFDSDMKRREGELDEVKQRVARLETLLKKRSDAKEEIIGLQLKTMVNESEGLGFFSEPLSGESYGPGGYSGMYGEGYGGTYGDEYGAGFEGDGGGSWAPTEPSMGMGAGPLE